MQAADALLPSAQPHLCAFIVLNKERPEQQSAIEWHEELKGSRSPVEVREGGGGGGGGGGRAEGGKN